MVVLSLALHPALGQHVGELGVPGQVRPLRAPDLFEVFTARIIFYYITTTPHQSRIEKRPYIERAKKRGREVN